MIDTRQGTLGHCVLFENRAVIGECSHRTENVGYRNYLVSCIFKLSCNTLPPFFVIQSERGHSPMYRRSRKLDTSRRWEDLDLLLWDFRKNIL